MVEVESQTIRTKFDDVLKSHIRRLLDSMPEAASLPFDLATITCLILLVERQSEIASFGGSSEVGFSEKTLLEELADIINAFAVGGVDEFHLAGRLALQVAGPFAGFGLFHIGCV